MSAAPRMAMLPPPGELPYGSLAPVLRPVLGQMLAESGWRAGRPARVLEAGSSGGILSALLRETDVPVGSIDFADPQPFTLEAAAERARQWPVRCHFVNGSLGSLAPVMPYDLILSWDLTSSTGLDPETVETLAGERQRRPGLWLALHEPAKHPFTMFGPYQYERTGLHLYQAVMGRGVWSAGGWVLR